MTETGIWTTGSTEACGRSINSVKQGPKISKTGTKLSKIGPKTSKTGTKLSKIGHKTSLNPVKRPCKPENGVIKPQIPFLRLNYPCVLLPLGSPTSCQKRSYVHVPVVSGPAQQRRWARVWSQGGYRVGIPGGYTGWVMGGLYRYPATLLGEGPTPAKRARKPLPGGWSGGCGARAFRLLGPPTPAPCRCLRGPLRCPRTLPRANPASWPIGRELTSFY